MSRAPHVLAIVALLVAALAPAQDAAGRKYALLVGVRDYKGTDLSALKYTENDVHELADLLRRSKYRRVTLLTQKEGYDRKNDDFFPTAENIRDGLKVTLADRQPADTVLVAFAGHGVQLKEPAGMYFCPQKADLTKPETLIALDEVYAALKECKAATRLLIVDACRNDPTAGRAATVANLASVTRPELPKPPGGVAALFSCSAGEKAFESDRLKHGVFFHHLIEGWKGKAANKNGEVDLLGLAQYVMAEVPETARDEFGLRVNQRPHLLSDVQRVVLGTTELTNAQPEPVRKLAGTPVSIAATEPPPATPTPRPVAPVAADALLLDGTIAAFGVNWAELAAGMPGQQNALTGLMTTLQASGATNVRRLHGAVAKLADGNFGCVMVLECAFDFQAYLRATATQTVDRALGIVQETNGSQTLVASLPGVGAALALPGSGPLLQAHLQRLAARQSARSFPEFAAAYAAADKSKALWAVARFDPGPTCPPSMINIATRSTSIDASLTFAPQPTVRFSVKLKDAEDANAAYNAIRGEVAQLFQMAVAAANGSGNPALQALVGVLNQSSRIALAGREVVLAGTVDAATWQRVTAGQ